MSGRVKFRRVHKRTVHAGCFAASSQLLRYGLNMRTSKVVSTSNGVKASSKVFVEKG